MATIVVVTTEICKKRSSDKQEINSACPMLISQMYRARVSGKVMTAEKIAIIQLPPVVMGSLTLGLTCVS